MADNVVANAGSGGATFATDDDGTAHHPYTKIEWGADNTQTPVSTGGSALPIQDGGNSLTVDNGGTFVVQEDGAALTALQLIDDVVHVDDAAFTLGTSKGVMIMGFAGTQSVNANDAAALACETDGALHIHDGGNSITVDGTVTANLSATDNAVLDSIDTNTTTLAGAVSGTEVRVDVVTSALPSGAATETTLDAVKTAVEIIDNAISGSEMQVDVVGALPAGTNAIGKLAANSGVDIGDVDVTSVPNASSHYRNVDANAEDQIKGSAGTLYWLHAMNMTASVAYVHLYDATAASVTPGTTTPDYTFPLATQGDTNGAGVMMGFPNGLAFANGLTLVVTTTIDGSAGDPGTNGVFVNAGYA